MGRVMLVVEGPGPVEDLLLTLGSIGACVAAIVVGVIALRNRRR